MRATRIRRASRPVVADLIESAVEDEVEVVAEREPLAGGGVVGASFGRILGCSPFGVANWETLGIIPPVEAKKKQVKRQREPAPAPAAARVAREIRLQPSTSDYETFVRTTAKAMGKAECQGARPKPSAQLLSLLNLGV
jgi:hypothetical protein